MLLSHELEQENEYFLFYLHRVERPNKVPQKETQLFSTDHNMCLFITNSKQRIWFYGKKSPAQSSYYLVEKWAYKEKASVRFESTEKEGTIKRSLAFLRQLLALTVVLRRCREAACKKEKSGYCNKLSVSLPFLFRLLLDGTRFLFPYLFLPGQRNILEAACCFFVLCWHCTSSAFKATPTHIASSSQATSSASSFHRWHRTPLEVLYTLRLLGATLSPEGERRRASSPYLRSKTPIL